MVICRQNGKAGVRWAAPRIAQSGLGLGDPDVGPRSGSRILTWMFPMRSVKSSSPATIITTQKNVSPNSVDGTRAFPKELHAPVHQQRTSTQNVMRVCHCTAHWFRHPSADLARGIPPCGTPVIEPGHVLPFLNWAFPSVLQLGLSSLSFTRPVHPSGALTAPPARRPSLHGSMATTTREYRPLCNALSLPSLGISFPLSLGLQHKQGSGLSGLRPAPIPDGHKSKEVPVNDLREGLPREREWHCRDVDPELVAPPCRATSTASAATRMTSQHSNQHGQQHSH